MTSLLTPDPHPPAAWLLTWHSVCTSEDQALTCSGQGRLRTQAHGLVLRPPEAPPGLLPIAPACWGQGGSAATWASPVTWLWWEEVEGRLSQPISVCREPYSNFQPSGFHLDCRLPCVMLTSVNKVPQMSELRLALVGNFLQAQGLGEGCSLVGKCGH